MTAYAGASLTGSVSEILKRVYDTDVYDHLNSGDDLMAKIPKEYTGDGEEFYTAHRVGGTGAMGFQAENASLPTPGYQQYANSVVTPKEFWSTLKLSQKLISLSKTRKGAFKRGLQSEMEGHAKDWRKTFEAKIVGDGSGRLAAVTTATTATNTMLITNLTDARKFQKGMVVDLWDGEAFSGDTAYDAAQTVTSITFTASGANIGVGSVSNAAIDGIYTAGSRTASAAYDMHGLDALIHRKAPPQGGDALFGIIPPFRSNGAPSVSLDQEYTWASAYLDNGGTARPLTTRLLSDACDAVRIQGNGEVDLIALPYGVKTDFAVGQLLMHRNFNTTSIAGQHAAGYDDDPSKGQYVQFRGIDLCPNRMMPAGTVWGIDTSQLYLNFWQKPTWWDDGEMLRRSPDNTTTYQAERFAVCETVLKSRNSHFRIEDVAGDEVAVA